MMLLLLVLLLTFDDDYLGLLVAGRAVFLLLLVLLLLVVFHFHWVGDWDDALRLDGHDLLLALFRVTRVWVRKKDEQH